MKDKRSSLTVGVMISTPKYGEIFKKAISLGLDTKTEMASSSFGVKMLCLKDFYPEKDGYLKSELFEARMDFLSAIGRPSWDCLWEDKTYLNEWLDYNLIFRELFRSKNGEEFILVFFAEGDGWGFDFKKLSEYKFSSKDKAVCLA